MTNAAHIFSEATNTDFGDNRKVRYSLELQIISLTHHFIFQKDYTSSMWAVMEQFGQQGFRDELDGSKIHRLANIMTLDHFLHTQFDRLALWLEADEVSHYGIMWLST